MKVRRRSQIHQITIEDSGGTRTLHFGDTIQSSMALADHSGGGLEYVDFFHLPLTLRSFIGRTLFIGLGGASGPRQFLHDYPTMKIDVVEIDPEVVRLAREFFGFESGARCAVHETDGLTYLERSRRRWDLIVIDAYSTERGDLVVPEELTTPEFFALCSRRLSDDGVVVFNCAASPDERLTREIHEAIGQVFRCQIAFEAGTGENTVMIASAAALESRTTRLAAIVREALRKGVVSRPVLLKRCRQLAVVKAKSEKQTRNPREG